MLTTDNETDISKIVVDCAFVIHKSLGPGLLESAYEACLNHELQKKTRRLRAAKNHLIHL